MKVSVIIPTYNRPGYLGQAVHSVLEQTHPVFEIIIVDDGSLPEYRGRIAGLAKLDDRIRVFHFSRNKGVSAARNHGLEKSTGDYILFLDDDDLIHREMLESNLNLLNKSKTDIVASSYDIFYDRTDPAIQHISDEEYIISPDAILYSWKYENEALLEERPFSALIRQGVKLSSCLIKKIAIHPARFPEDLTRGEDSFFLLTLAVARCRFKINHKHLCFCRIHPNNSMSITGWQQASIQYSMKLLRERMVSNVQDHVIVHLRLASILLRCNRLQGLKHLLMGARILFTLPLSASWPLLLRFVFARTYNRWRWRKVIKIGKTIHRRQQCH